MKVLFQADADLNQNILLATVRQQPGIDFQSATKAGLIGLNDQEVPIFPPGTFHEEGLFGKMGGHNHA